MPIPFAVIPASYLYLLRGGDGETQVLLQLRTNTGYMDGHWAAAAAGHVERGETAPAAAIREASEELGIEIAVDDLVMEFTMHRTQGDKPIDERVDFFFSARTWQREPRLMEPDKAAGLAWFPVAELPAATVPHERYAIQHLGQQQRYLSYGF